ncbi:F-actin-monooxygenase Mical isoform X1 [Scaptodrosophila lebanonensis]|uniref:F-actin monooxygenase n=1 Tax=Drosophila lebanonensis TaxID=7225 RepID=A0A6J2TIK2_DROLE|nr:F-actin-monooxygenase Mical isoform X1 [Scaptodrosophila lebanonensis]XP_030375844.1 F-actin-monooxygenase Mical isoform X1 [Scaptodrosophila lebanonensis]
MSRQQRHHQQQQQLLTTQQQQQQALLMAEHAAAAEAAELFDLLCVATTMRQILALHRAMCDAVGLRPSPLNDFYPKLKAKVRSWKAQALWKKFDARAAHRVYGKANACAGTRVLVIGAGPCGLRTAIEAQLLGAKVVVLEKRDRITRNNVLHLWPFVITDLRNLGAKKFYGKFCAGSIDHISIRQLQCMLLKVALLLGVEIHEGVSFEHAIEPSGDGSGWKAAVTPTDHAVSHYEFDVLVGADGKRNMLDFRRKEFRGKLAIAITANFINKKTEAEAKVEEISGVAFIFNQAFFKELYGRTGIDLENIVYYKDETHYFVMTAKKHSLIDKGVIIEDMADPAELLAPANVDTQKLHDYAREAAEFSTKYQMLNLEFAVNHYGKPDVAMFDFTSMFAAEMSCRVLVRKGCRLLQCLVGDSLLEPFWPTGSGCARGFLSSMDAAYAIKLWANPQNSALGVLAQRESIYRLLNQTTPDTLQRDISAYTVDPATRYPNLNRESVNSWQVKHLIDTDDPAILEQTFMDTHALHAPHVETPGRRKRRSGDSLPQGATLLRWISAQLHAHRFVPELKEPSDIFRNGRVLCALINRYRPDLVDLAGVKDMSPLECNELAFGVLDRELHIDRVMTAKQSLELTDVESRVWLQYLDQICELFRGEIPHIKHPKMDFSDLRQKYRINHAHAQPDFSKLLHTKPKAKSPMQDAVDVPITVQRRSVLDDERVKRQRRHEQLMNTNVAGTNAASTGAGAIGTNVQQAQNETPRRSKKRRQADKSTNIEERQQRLKEIEENRQERMSKRRQARYHQTQNFYKSLQMLQAGNLLREGAAEDGTPFEDYSIFLYRQQAPVFNDRVKELERKLLFPDRERGDIPSAMPRNGADEQFSDRIKDMEQRMQGRGGLSSDKKPKDLMRAIGKIDSSDWNVREIEKKIEQSKKTEIHGPKGREKVPKWSKEQFQARQHKMSKPQRQDSREAEKFKEIDETLKVLDKQLKEGHNLDVGERGRNKVASIAGQFGKKDEPNSDEKNATSGNTNTNTTVIPKSSSKVALAFKKQAASEKCRFCKQTVYLMEKTTVEGLVLHRNCLKCHHCHTSLRMGGYAFDRDDPQGRFYCTQHFRLPPKPLPQRVNKARKSTTSQATPVATQPATVAPDTIEPMDTTVPADQVDVHQSSRTSGAPMSASGSVDAKSDDEAEIIDEHEWSGRNFLPESNNDSESDLSSSDESDTESESELFEEADDSPFGAQTLQLATDWIGKQNYENSDDSDDFYDSSEGIADDGKDDTEGEEFKKARELRREEVRLRPLPANLPTDTETEVQTESESTSPDEVELNSATEISTDSEFDNDEIIRQAPKIFIDDTHLKKPTKVQIKSTIITPNAQGAGIAHQKQIATREKGGSYLQKYQPQPALPQFKPLVQVDPTLLISSNRVPLQNPRPGDYLLNKTASTEGIASKKSLELKKRYLLGESANGNKIQKSGSTSVLDSRIRSFQSNISECQKLLNPSSDISAGMKSFLDRTKLGESARDELMRSATSNVINDLRVELKIQKAPSSTSTDNEKENVFVNSKNELNKGMEYSDAVNATLLEQLGKKSLPNTPTNNKTHIEVIDLVTPDKPVPIIDLTKVEIPTKMVESNVEFINSIKILSQEGDPAADSNKIIDLTGNTVTNPDTATKPDVSKDVKECIPDILGHIKADKQADGNEEEQEGLLCNSDEEKRDSPEKAAEQYEHDTVQIEVPNIPWSKSKSQVISTTTSGSSSSSGSSSIEDIQHYILDSTTSPDTHTTGTATGGKHTVPRLEVTDSSGALMQVDSLMIVDGKYIGDPEDVKYLDMPLGVVVPQMSLLKSTEVEEVEDHDADVEPITATPEPAERTVIEADRLPPLADMGPAKIKPSNLKFDTKNENKIESLKNLPLIVDSHNVEHTKAVKPITLNLSGVPRTPDTPTTPVAIQQHDSDKTPTAELQSRGSDSETERTGTGQVLTETELSDWTADDCISENFVDMEFVLNSNKGTIKRRKERKRLGTPKMPSSSEVINKMVRQAPVVKMDGILKSIDIDDIEFMDTGSEGSCAEAYSATNTALLHNRGYMEYIEAPPKLGQTSGGHNSGIETTGVVSDKCKPMLTKRDEKLGIDYIEQGAYIMHDDAKTPVNETPHLHPLTASVMTQSLTDSSTLNDLDEDSLGVGTSHSQTITKTQPTTTEESEALTVVTSPLDTSSPRVLDQFASLISAGKGSETAGCSTPSSSEKQPKTTQSTATTSSGSNTTSSVQGLKDVPVQNVQGEDLQFQFEYVRALQQRISQISTARDSLDSRKQRRKSSKGEPPNLQQQKTVIESTQSDAQIDNTTTAITRSRSSSTSNKVPEIPTLTSKLEEITKERTKQKDLIHDLVMDKLQSKKQLNAEKRLHRSRQRSLLTSGYASGSSLSPTPKLAAATTTHDANCTSQAHYHESTAEVHPTNVHSVVRTASPDNFKEPNSVQKSATYVSPYRTVRGPTRSADLYKPRPFSEHMDVEQICGLERYKLNKTPSFSHASVSKASEFATPVAPVRLQRAGNEKFQVQTTISASTENLRSEARARARLKSNSELGLSPEEKMQLLRKRLQYDPTSNIINAKQQVLPAEVEVEPNDLVVRVRKMSASKSVNDLAYMANQQHLQQQENDAVLKAKAADFISDPNLVASSEGKAAKAKSGRRQKDPERRKSLIQSLSSFFHKGNSATATPSHTNNKEQSNVAASSHSEAAERPGTSSSGTPTVSLNSDSGGGGGVFSRFRISPKSKEKSKSCFDLRSFGFGEKECLPSHTLTNNTPMPTTAAKTSQTKHSQDYLNNTNNSSCQKQTNNGRAVAAANAQAFSSSTPQLYIHKPHYLATANALDDQTPPPIPPLPLNYQRSDDESYATETREHKKQRAISKASRQAELKRLRIAQEIQREQEEIEVQLKELEARGVLIEKALRGEAQNFESLDMSKDNDEKLLKELLEIWRNITALKKRDEELGIRQQELQLEYRHAQLKEELNLRLSSNKLDKSSADVAAEGAILNEMLEIVAKRAALRPTASQLDLTTAGVAGGASTSTEAGITLTTRDQPHGREESNI